MCTVYSEHFNLKFMLIDNNNEDLRKCEKFWIGTLSLIWGVWILDIIDKAETVVSPQKVATTACFIQEESSGGWQIRKMSCLNIYGRKLRRVWTCTNHNYRHIPQCPLLGPLLFFIYINVNDLPNSLKNADYDIFADDT
jgi:hypothetical protein